HFDDLEEDGSPELAVAKESVPGSEYRDRRNETVEDVSYMSGFVVNGVGRDQVSMELAVGDYNRDGLVDLLVTTFSDDYETLFRNDGDMEFSDVSAQAALLDPTIPFLGWGTGFLDFDNDGLLDLFIANGHVFRNVEHQGWGTTYAQRPLLFRNIDGQRFQMVPATTDSGLADVIPSRGAAFGDLFNDGHMDVVINDIVSPPTILSHTVHDGNQRI